MRQAAGWPAGAVVAVTAALLLMLGGRVSPRPHAGDACGGHGHGLPDCIRHRDGYRVRASTGQGSAHGYAPAAPPAAPVFPQIFRVLPWPARSCPPPTGRPGSR